MVESVYVETSIFSFYHERRTSPAVIAMRDWTRQWCDGHIRRMNTLLGLHVPMLVTPLELMGGE